MSAQQLAIASFSVQENEESGLSLFDRFRAPALRVLCKDKPVEKLLQKKWFRRLVEQSGFSTTHFRLVSENGEQEFATRPNDSELYSELEREFPALAQIAASLRLAREEQLILAFIANIRCDAFWNEFDDRFGMITYGPAITVFSEILKIDARQVSQALDPASRLITSGLIVRSAGRWARSLLSNVYALHREIDATMLRIPTAWDDFFASKFDSVRYENSCIDFAHMERDIAIILQVIESMSAERTGGVHVLLHGPPGTGKTTLAREIAFRLGLDLFEVRKDNAGTNENDGEMRFSIFNLAQRLGVAKRECLILFDEMEDLLPSAHDRFAGKSNRLHKGWICDSLERTRLPTIWTANRLSGVDPAILRRMTFTLEVANPPKSKRKQLLEQSLSGKGISQPWFDRTAGLEIVTPAATAQLGRLAKALPREGEALELALDRWLDERLKLVDASLPHPIQEEHQFRCDLLNSDVDPQKIVEGLKRSNEGRICLYGPPGTGKTAYANYLAEQLDQTALLRKGSDLRSKWVGETERNIAWMFREAIRENAVLILDEADSFLGSRDSRMHSWETNETSEFLVQLESYNGIFVATTNRFKYLDQAFMRRFDFKVRIEFLTEQQRSWFFSRLVQQTTPQGITRQTKERLAQLEQLTPGDFITAKRRVRFGDEQLNEKTLLSALVHEVKCKKASEGRPIGFRWAD